MKKSILILSVIVVLLTAIVAISGKTNESTPLSNVAVVDIQKVLESTKDWKELNQSYQEDQQFYQRQLDALVAEYKKMKDEGASNEELFAKQQEILAKKAQYEQTLQSTYNAKTQVIVDQIRKRINSYADFMGYDLILTKEAVIYSKEVFDITDQVIEYLRGFENK
ncbi:OmpH family outer membrane protein [Kosmotoga sp.]|jgi:outer membrane protein|uniref:OmpH family outer membrane protein n=1 Tax=Kosmotoga sp. TaxID=1955248 RepID=UPI0024ABAE20|nr:OmpH family outer membrane protein [Kosmotoga sp.]MDI3523236.1 outer membrane protein [Kosmotoga sp.]MDK2952835.1 outer membrane protein [Kosmotoga sp.]